MNLTARLGGESAIINGIIAEFRLLNRPPHPSCHEEAASALMAARLESLGLFPLRDGRTNLMADVPATDGYAGGPLTILQGHMDMVCAVRPGSGFDPLRDSVSVITEEGFLRSDGRSSLGADNDLGNAAVLWLLGQGVPHGPLRLMFTVAEEIGLAGAREIDRAWLAGARYLINTDGFHLGTAIVSAAGGRRESFSRPLKTVSAPAGVAYRVALSGFTGGHSGDDIHRGRGNPIKLLGGLLSTLNGGWALAELDGGTGHNVIPAAASAVVVVPHGAELAAATDRLRAEAVKLHGDTDPGLRVELSPAPMPALVWADTCRDETLAMAGGLTCGVLGWHEEFPGVVASSANLGRVCVEDGVISLWEFIRCTQAEEESRHARRHAVLAAELGFDLLADGYPGWPGERDNPLAQLMSDVYRRETGREMTVSAVHVGLEPSFWHEKAPELTMVSSGPDILDAHSVDERAPLSSLPPYAALLAGTLEALARQ